LNYNERYDTPDRFMPKDPVKEYLSKLGKKGGSKKSPAKTAGARKAIAERWRKHREEKGKK
jgi:hypothetical protein